ncbi:MAG: CoA-binding protein [Bacteroidales bacterium]|jgi:predicted CoA-binding protein|nr:CoA-binding protein [Bacteroidales bacterium]
MQQNNEKKKTLVLGGSIKPERFANRAIVKLRGYGHPVVSVGLKEGKVLDVDIQTGTPDYKDIHTISLYLGPRNQTQYYPYILNLKPKRIIFNPGTENPELFELAAKNNISVVEYCTLILLDTNTF